MLTSRPETWDGPALLAAAADLEAVTLSSSYGTPALKRAGQLMARLRDDDTLVLGASWEERERARAVAPEVYFLTDHDRTHPYVLLRLSQASTVELRASL
jgi:hypothetical protein